MLKNEFSELGHFVQLYYALGTEATGTTRLQHDETCTWYNNQSIAGIDETILVTMVRAANERSLSFYFGCSAWAMTCVFLVVWDFGVIAFCGSVLLSIWVFGLREKFSNEETASAYSVFNQDGKAIVGGFTAAQFDRQMRGGIGGTNDVNDPAKGDVAVAAIVASGRKQIAETHSEDERLRRRKAAAAAAERRILPQPL